MASMSFVTASTIDPAEGATWHNKQLLSFDIDWAHDDVVSDTIDLVEKADVPATWFITNDSPIIGRLRSNPKFELGIHPNFLPLLLQGKDDKGASAEEVIDRLLEIVPEAKAVRAHSLVQSGRLLEIYRNRGLTHECGSFIPESSSIELKPWTDWFDVINVPFGWEDDFWCDRTEKNQLPSSKDQMRGYNFHPIHVFLNTEELARYERARCSFRDPATLLEHRNQSSIGVRNQLLNLMAMP